jgi:hypothetical protein
MYPLHRLFHVFFILVLRSHAKPMYANNVGLFFGFQRVGVHCDLDLSLKLHLVIP